MTNTVSRIISDETLSHIVQIESAGRPNAKAGTSSATGLGQFVDGTWMQVVTRHRPDLLEGRTRAQVLAMRLDPPLAVEMLARFTEDNAAVLGALYSDGDLYLAHFAGAATARRLMRADAHAPCANVFSASAIVANRSILAGKSCGEVRLWAARKMAAAGGRDWVGVHLRGAKPPPAKRTRKAIAAGATVSTGAVAVGTQHSSFWPWLIGVAIVVAVLAIACVVWRKRRALAPAHIEFTGDSHGVG